MTPSARLKLRVITASVIGLALFQLVIGRYEYYPFIHWTMFSLPQHNPPPSKVGETVVVAMFANGDEHTVNLS